MEKLYKEEKSTIYKFDVDFGFNDLRYKTITCSEADAKLINENLNFTKQVLHLLHTKIFRDDWGMAKIHSVKFDDFGNITDLALITTNPCGYTSDTSKIHHYDYPFSPISDNHIKARVKTYLDQLYEVYIKVPGYSLERTDFEELTRDLCKHIGEVYYIYKRFGYKFENSRNQNCYILRRKNDPNKH